MCSCLVCSVSRRKSGFHWFQSLNLVAGTACIEAVTKPSLVLWLVQTESFALFLHFNPPLRSCSTVTRITVPSKASTCSSHIVALFLYCSRVYNFFLMEEISHLRASRRAHLTHVFGKIATILKSDESPKWKGHRYPPNIFGASWTQESYCGRTGRQNTRHYCKCWYTRNRNAGQ